MTITLTSSSPSTDPTLGWDPDDYFTFVVTTDTGTFDTIYTGVTVNGFGGIDAITNGAFGSGWEGSIVLSAGDTVQTITVRRTGGWDPNTNYGVIGEPANTGEYLILLNIGGGGGAGFEDFPIPRFTTGDTSATDPYSSESLTAGEAERFFFDLPMFVAPNVTALRNAVPEWRLSGRWDTGSDDTGDDFVTTFTGARASDGWADVRTRAATPDAVHYLIFDLTDVTFDTIAILGHNFLEIEATEVAVEIASGDDFTTDLLELASWTDDFGQRLVATDLDDLRYTDVRWLRIRIESAGVIAPEIGELYLGTRYTPEHRQNSPEDDESLAAGVATAETEGGDQQRVRRWSGRLSATLTWAPDNDEYIATFRDFFAATRWGADPFLWIPNPSTDPATCYFARGSDGMEIVNTEYVLNSVSVSIIEQAPYVSKDLVT